MSAVPVSTRSRTRVKRRSRTATAVANRLTAFALLAAIAYLASSLVGQVMVEKARLESIRATDRALEARKVVAEIENRLNEMTNLDAIDEWARAHNFLSIGQLAQTLPGQMASAAVPSAAVDEHQNYRYLVSDRSAHHART